MGRSVVAIWAVLLTVLGLSVAYYKVFYLGLPLKPQNETEVWTIQAKMHFDGSGGPAIAEFYLPEVMPGFLKIDEDFISGKFGLSIQEEGDNRKAQWAVRRAKGEHSLYYRVTVARSSQLENWQSRPSFPKPPEYPEPYASAIRAILDDVRGSSADVATYTTELLRQLNSPTPSENVEIIRNSANNPEAWVKEVINILHGVRIPARMLWAINLNDAANHASLQPFLQVHNENEWLTFDPHTGKRDMPANFLAWKVGDKPLFTLVGGKSNAVDFSVIKTYKEQMDVARSGVQQLNSFFTKFSLLTLPVPSQNTYRVLLMVPLGALVVVFMRTFVGIKTFGTFMPVLIALAFRETQLAWGLTLFTVIVAIGLMFRFYLEHLMLLLIPRLTAILIIVVMLMLIISMVSNQLGAERVLSIALFPMVILSMTIERMSITWEENGARTALIQGIGSLSVATLGYLVMTNEQLMYVMFVFPELLLVLLAVCLLMGRYSGYRLTELYRFREMKKIGK